MNQLDNIKLSQYGKSLGTREIGKELRNNVLNAVRNGRKVLFDFSDIEIISSAFADELFGKLFMELGENAFKANIRINNFKNDEAKKNHSSYN